MLDWSKELDFQKVSAIKKSLEDDNNYVNLNRKNQKFDFKDINHYIRQLFESIYQTTYTLEENNWDNIFNSIVPNEELLTYYKYYRTDNEILHELILEEKIHIECFYPSDSPEVVQYFYEGDNHMYRDKEFNDFLNKIKHDEKIKEILLKEKSKVPKPPQKLKEFLFDYYNSILECFPLITDFWQVDVNFILAWILHSHNEKPYTFKMDSENEIHNTLLNFENDLVSQINKVKKVNSPILNYLLESMNFTKNSIGISEITFCNSECLELKLLILFYPSLYNWFKLQKTSKEFSLEKMHDIIKIMHDAQSDSCKLNYYLFEVLFGYNYCIELCRIRQEFKNKFNNDSEIMQRIDCLIESIMPLSNIATRIIFIRKITQPLLIFASSASILEVLDSLINILPEKVSLFNDIFQWIVDNILTNFKSCNAKYLSANCYEFFIKDFNDKNTHLFFMKDWSDFTFVDYKEIQEGEALEWYKKIEQKYLISNYIK